MLDLAAHYSQNPQSIKSIAERQNISVNYLEQLFRVIKKSGLVKSARGSQGGYVLSDKPDKITIGSILRAMEGSIAPVECVNERQLYRCMRYNDCVTKLVWEKITNTINDVVDEITLESLVEEHEKLKNLDGYMYYI